MSYMYIYHTWLFGNLETPILCHVLLKGQNQHNLAKKPLFPFHIVDIDCTHATPCAIKESRFWCPARYKFNKASRRNFIPPLPTLAWNIS